MPFNIDPSAPNQVNAGKSEDTPTNTKFRNTSSVTNGHFVSIIVMADDSLSASMTIGTELSNDATTKGFRIKSDSTLTFSNFDTVDYFVLVHSDDDKKHHFAKVTNLIVEDDGNGTSTCDAFEFEPKLGNEIPKGTKYRIITGINDTNNKIVALSVGLKQQDDSANLKNGAVCARPLFYFFNDRLDKKNELDHNTKYYALGKMGSSTTVTIAQDPNDGITFRTVSDFGKRIVDYSKYSLVVNMTDKLRTLDESSGGNNTSNEGGTVTIDYNVYKDAYINARRSSDNSITTRDTLGQTRYLHYDFSPEKCNNILAVIDNETRDSINQGSFSETRIIDNGRIMNKKINVFDPYRIRNILHRANLDDFVELKASFVSEASTNVFNIRTEYDLGTVLNAGDEVKIQDKIMLVSSIGSFTNPATLQTLTVRAEKKTESGQLFSSLSFTPTADDILSRRAYNPTDNTIITTMNLMNRTDNIEIAFNSANESRLFASISAIDEDKSMMTLSYTGDSYYSNPLEFIRGEYTIYSLKFDGEVEQINTSKESSQTFLDIKGRDKLNKLLSPIINKDTTFSEDIIYSSNSPTNTLILAVNLGSGVGAANVGSTFIETGQSSGDFASALAIGDKIFTERGYIGQITSMPTYGLDGFNRLTISTGLLSLVIAGENIYKESEKNYMFSKALGSSNFASSSPTSLVGSAGKGLIFTAGNTIDSTGAEVSALPNTSSNSHEKAIGYEINSPKNIKLDSAFECVLKDEILGASNITLTGGATTDGSANVTYTSNTNVQVGMFISGTGIPPNTRISAVNSATSSTLTTTATASGSSLTFTLGSKSTFDTVNTLIDFEIVSTSKKDNVTQIELAPYVPITLGRSIDFQGIKEQRIEQETSVALTVTANKSSGEIVVETTNTGAGFSNIKIGEPLYGNCFQGSQTEVEGFIGYVVDIIKFEQKANHIASGNPATNTTTYQILVDRNQSSAGNRIDLDIGDEILVSTRSRNHVNLSNTAHLWGGKIFSIPHQKHISTGLVPFNAVRTSTTDFISEFGNPYYKTINVDTFRLGTEDLHFDNVFGSLSFDFAGKYSGRMSPIKKNFTSYKFSPRVGNMSITEINQRGSNEEMPYDKRGHVSIYGSNISNMRRQGRDLTTSLIHPDVRASRDTLGRKYLFESVDDSFPRLFFYITSDLLPYSSLRTDSIFHEDGSSNATKSLTDYKLFLTDNSNKTDSGGNLILKDNNFQSLSFTTNSDITKLKRFGLMRLTECVYDEYFNLINPEKSTEEIYFNSPFGLGSICHRLTSTGELGTTLTIDSIGINSLGNPANEIIFASAVKLMAGDKIFIGAEFVGTINADSGSAITTHATNGATFTPSMDNTTNRAAVRLTDAFQATTSGRKKDDSIFGSNNTADYHPLKGAIIPKTSNYNYGASGSTAFVDNDDTAINLAVNSEVVLPSIFGSGANSFLTNSIYTGGSNYNAQGRSVSYVLGKMLALQSDVGNPHGGLIGVVLDTYPIESGTGSLKVGDTTDVLGTGSTKRSGLVLDPTSNSIPREIVTLTSTTHHQEMLSPSRTTAHDYSSDSNRDSPADGAYLGFKLRLFRASWSAIESTVSSSNGNIYKYTIPVNGKGAPPNPDEELMAWLDLVDLTGCYLVPEVNTGTQTVDAIGGISLGLGHLADPIYIYSHEAATVEQQDGTASVAIHTSSQLDNGRAYRVMQPNANCLFETHPDEIQLNTLRPEYTKQANSTEMYNVKNNNYFYHEGGENDTKSGSEGVLSMFVMIDVDNKSNGGNLVVNNANTRTLLPSDKYELYISDGDNSIKRTVHSIGGNQNHALVIKDKVALNGILSLSETIVLDSLEELKIEPNRACIGSTVTIANEAEELLNELFEEEGLTFNNTSPAYPLFIAPKFTGSSLFSAINYILERKDLSLIINDSSYTVKPKEDTIFRTNILVNDDKIIDYETIDSGFDFYNQVVVYGSSHKADRKNLTSIQKIGRKTLEEVDSSLITQQDVDEKASKLLRLHGSLDKKIKVKVIPSGHEQLRAGDIIQFESKQENIDLDNYIVLDITHPISGFVTIEMGKYSKKLEDVFAELLLQSQSNSNKLRALSFNEKNTSVDFLEKVKLKEMALLIRTRASTGDFHLGFAATLNTNTNTFGFAGGTIALTNLLEEDLL